MGSSRSTVRRFNSQYLSRAILLSAVFLMGRGSVIAQTAPPGAPAQDSKQTAPQSGGVNTGGVHAAVLDSEHRPITAGGFVKSGPVIFQDVAQKAGLTAWKHTMGTPEKH